jgi:hypothetical protein
MATLKQIEKTIRAYAAGDNGLILDAIAVHRNNINNDTYRQSICCEYMREVDTTTPDLARRAEIRKLVLASR